MTENNQAVELRGALWMTVGGENFGGPGRIGLLALIAEHGSITRAAKAMNMSYKAAWDAVDTMSNLAREPLVTRLTGGKGGGGTRLTARGAQLVEHFRVIEQAHRRFVDQLSAQSTGISDDFLLIRSMNMKTSARNQFLGKVSAIKTGAVNDEIELTIIGGRQLVATITRDSTEALGLRVGADAFALVKASSIILVTQDDDARFSARNRLSGSVARIQPGAVNTEIVLELSGGGSLAAIITNDSCERLGLRVGASAAAIFKASSVILGTPA